MRQRSPGLVPRAIATTTLATRISPDASTGSAEKAGEDAGILVFDTGRRRVRRFRQEVNEVRSVLSGALQTADADDLEAAVHSAFLQLAVLVADLSRQGPLR